MLVVVVWILVQTGFFQNFIINQVTKKLSKNLNTTVSIQHVDLDLFNKMVLEGTLVLDRNNDTLLYAGTVRVNITDWFFFKDNITLKYIELDDAIINLKRKDSVWNYQFLVDYFSRPAKKKETSTNSIQLDLKEAHFNNVKIWQQDEWIGMNRMASVTTMNLEADKIDLKQKIIKITSVSLDYPVFSQYDYKGLRPRKAPSSKKDKKTKAQWNPEGWKLSVGIISINNGGVAVEREGGQPSVYRLFDERHVVLSDLNGHFKNLTLTNDTLTAKLLVSGKDRGGFEIQELNADFTFTPVLMEFKNLNLVTGKSHLKNYFAMHYNTFDDMQDFVHAVTLDGRFVDSKLSSEDLAYFVPEASAWNMDFAINGTVTGKIDNLTARNLIISAGENNYIAGNLSLRGLPDVDKTFIDFRIEKLKTNYKELATLIPALKGITNPRLSAFGNIHFSGSYTGYFRDFVAYGSLSTDIGLLQADIHLQVPVNGNALYQGKVSTNNFQLGKFINSTQIGNIAFTGKINGKGFETENLDLGIDGTINKIKFNDYTYTNINAHGDIVKKLFTGSASINDANIIIDTLIGTINFSKKNPQFNLEADVDKLNLKDLGFTRDSISLTGNFNLDFTGSTIDNFIGSAKLYNAELMDNGQQLSFDSLYINSSITDGRKLLTVQTNELDASINGSFKILDLPEAFQLFLYKYYPAYINKPSKSIENQDFTFLIKTKNVSEYLSLFDKKLSGLNNASIIGNINIAQNSLDLIIDVPQFNFSNISFNNIHLAGSGTMDTLRLIGQIDDVVINDSLHSPGTKIKIVAANDISDVTINATANKAVSAANISARIETKEDGFKLTFNPSTFTINQKQWNIKKNGEIELNKKMLMAQNIKFSQNGQEIFIYTTPSEIGSSNDVIITAENVIIEDITPLFLKTPKVEGLLNGNIRINDPFGKMAVLFETKTSKFKFENDSIGVLKASGKYLSAPGSISINAISDNDSYNFIANFDYNPKDSINQLNGSVVFKKSQIHILEEYLSGIFSDIYGTATGKLTISGNTGNPKLTGSIFLDNTSMTVDYTQCLYTIANHSVITFNPDEIDFGSIRIIDTLNNTATLSGKIYHSFFDNFFFNELHLKTDAIGSTPGRFILLNTTEKDNNQFYGNVIGRAELSLNGFVTDMRMNISAEPTDSSHIYLPIGESAGAGSLDYIDFITFGREMKVDLSVRENSNIKVDMELTANPLVKIDVILDETTGDVIKAQGNGKLNISAGTKDALTIRGRYNIAEGEYTFNFQTFLKTPFTLQQGFIEWHGDPYLANLNIDAIYRAENVNLSNIPTSTGFSNAKGDVNIIFKLRGTLKDPSPSFEFKFPFDNPLKSDPIASEYLKTRYQADKNELNKQVTSLLLFNTFMSSDQSLLSSNNSFNFVTKSVGQLLSNTLTSSLNSWLQKLLNTNSINLYTNINASDINFQKGLTQNEIQNVGNFGLKTAFLNNKLLVTVGGNVDRRLARAATNSNSNFLFTPDVSFEYFITPDGRFRVIGFNRSDAAPGDIAGVTRLNRTGIQLSYRKDFDTFAEFFTNKKRKKR